MKIHTFLKDYGYIQAHSQSTGTHPTIIYVLPDVVRTKIARVLNLSQKPDFALILHGRLEQGGRRVFNEAETRYVLFHYDITAEEATPRIISSIDHQFGKKQYRLKSHKHAWDTNERVWVKKKKTYLQSMQIDQIPHSA